MVQKYSTSLPPHNKEAEICLLGSLMVDINAVVRVADFLLVEDFYHPEHQIIYQVMLDLFQRNTPIDIISVANTLKEKDQLEKIGGQAYLSELVSSVPTSSNIVNYANIVQKKRVLRDLISASHEIGSIAHNEAEDSDVLLDQAEKRIFSIAQKSLTQRFRPLREGLENTFERIDQLSKHKGGLRGLATGFTKLDNTLAGLQKSDLIILAARPSMGKSALALDIARSVAVFNKTPVGIFSLEMSQDQIIDRMLAGQANVDLWKLRTGRLSEKGEQNDFAKIQSALGILAEAPIFIDDTSGINILQMRAMARRLQANYGLGLLIIDYLQLMNPMNSMHSMVQQVTENSRALKTLAKELNIPVLVLSQLSRAVEQRTPHRPRLSDLRESGSIEQDADVVMFIYREDFYKENPSQENIADIIIAKHRNGPVGQVSLYFDGPRVTFRNLEEGSFEKQDAF
jgi:replicative DNA helicase